MSGAVRFTDSKGQPYIDRHRPDDLSRYAEADNLYVSRSSGSDDNVTTFCGQLKKKKKEKKEKKGKDKKKKEDKEKNKKSEEQKKVRC